MRYLPNAAFVKTLPGRVAPDIQQICQQVETEAKRRAPVRTGNLRRSISHTVDPIKGEGVVFATAAYGGFVEYGTRYMAPRPYLRPALDLVIRSNRGVRRAT